MPTRIPMSSGTRWIPVLAAAVVILGGFATGNRVAGSNRSRAPYRATDDTLLITIAGLPEGASANVTVAGPDGFSTRVTASQTLTGLVPGTYTIAAGNVAFFGFTLVPDSATHVVTVTENSASTVHVTYSPVKAPQFVRGLLTSGFRTRTMHVLGSIYDYQIFIPHDYTPSRSWPVILFLHGSGERGSDNVIQMRSGVGPYVQAHASTFPAVVVFPQMPITGPEGSATPYTITLLDLIATTALDQTLREVQADSSRIYITGLSMGALRLWEIAFARPKLFAAGVPIAGYICGHCLAGDRAMSDAQADNVVARRLAGLPIWIFHGGIDVTAPVARDRTLVKAFESIGAPVKYTEYPGVGHDAWGRTYQDPAFWDWLFAQHR